MRIRKPNGSKERLFELFDRVTGYNLTENEDMLDFMRMVKNDYPNDKDIHTKFLNLFKRKGGDVARQEYKSKYSPETQKTEKDKNREILNKRKLDSKKKELYNEYRGIILMIQNLIKQKGLNQKINSAFSSYPKLSGMVMNKKYSNLFNDEIKDIISFNKKYLKNTQNLIPLESIELIEKNIGNNNEFINLTIRSYVSSTSFFNNMINEDDFLFYQIELDVNFDEKNDDDSGVKTKLSKLKKLADKYNRLALSDNDLDDFLNDFIVIITTPNKFYQEKNFTMINEDIGNEREELIKLFIKYIGNELGILNNLPDITISNNIEDATELKSFGKYVPEDNTLLVVIANRNLADFLRTLCHELIHHKQYLDGVLSIDSGDTGSDVENEANAKAGVYLREFGKNNSKIYEI